MSQDDATRPTGLPLPGKPISLWLDTTPGTNFPGLDPGHVLDAVVLGGGLTGVNTACLLRREGLSCAVIEARRIGAGVTGNTTAKITSQHGLIYDHLTGAFGRDAAHVHAMANQAAIERYASLASELNIDCDFVRRPAYVYAETDDEVRAVERETNAAKSAGIPAVFESSAALPWPVKGAIRFDDQAQFHPRKYLLALVDELRRGGTLFFEKTRVIEFREARGAEGAYSVVTTDKGTIRARHVVLATHYPVVDPAFFFARLYPKRSYVLGARVAGPLPDGMFYSAGSPYRSVRAALTAEEGGEILLVGGASHKTGHHGSAVERYREVERFARDRFPVQDIVYRWSTQDNVTPDKLPYIGRLPGYDRAWTATGFAGWGMSQSMVAAMIITDAILERGNAWAPTYSPKRLNATGLPSLLTENVHAVGYLVSSNLTPPPAADLAAIAPGQGKVVMLGKERAAVARDLAGKLHAVSPNCTHMGCVLKWNDAELSWDCPCHGSRFELDGRVIHSPAKRDLRRLDHLLPPADRAPEESDEPGLTASTPSA